MQGLTPVFTGLHQQCYRKTHISYEPMLTLSSSLSLEYSEYINPFIPTQIGGRLKWSYAITRLTAHFMHGLMFDLVICKFRKKVCKFGHTWHRMSLLIPDVVKQSKPKPKPIVKLEYIRLLFMVTGFNRLCFSCSDTLCLRVCIAESLYNLPGITFFMHCFQAGEEKRNSSLVPHTVFCWSWGRALV